MVFFMFVSNGPSGVCRLLRKASILSRRSKIFGVALSIVNVESSAAVVALGCVGVGCCWIEVGVAAFGCGSVTTRLLPCWPPSIGGVALGVWFSIVTKLDDNGLHCLRTHLSLATLA